MAERELHDHFFKQAKRDGYRSRAAYKLIEIDERKKVLRAGDRVLDCGCAPGSWIQIAARTVGPRGHVVGIDLNPLDHPKQLDNSSIHVGDLREIDAHTLTEGALFDVVLSDMAPSTTGDRTIDHHGSVRLCNAVLDRLSDFLMPGGNVVLKVFEGEAYPELLSRMSFLFEKAKGFKPKASRTISTEMYVIAHGYRSAKDRTPDSDLAPPRPKPPPGWGA